MSKEHNPIARLISQIQQKWINEIGTNEEIQLVRWLIKPDQKRLYRGFLKLESTPYGSLPCVSVALLTPFEDEENHSKSLIKDWIENFKNDKEIQKAIANKTLEFDWNVEDFEDKLKNAKNHNALLLEMLTSFQKKMPNNDLPLVLVLYPNAVRNNKEYQKWLDRIVNNAIPKTIKIMFFDDVNERSFDTFMEKHNAISKSLSVPLDLDGAINKLATQGNPNDPEVQFRKCMIEMGNSTKKNNLTRLKEWGSKGLEITKKTGIKSNYATAHIIYAGYLFSFKEFDLIDELLIRGLAIAKQGLLAGDKVCEPIIVQNYGLQAGSKQMQKKIQATVTLYCKQAEVAIAYNLGIQSLSAWWLAYNVIKKKDINKYEEIVTKAYNYGVSLDATVLKSTCMNFIGADYYNWCDKKSDRKKCEEINEFMTEIDGKDWLKNVEDKRKEMKKRKFKLNWF